MRYNKKLHPTLLPQQAHRFMATILLASLLLQSCASATLNMQDDGAAETQPNLQQAPAVRQAGNISLTQEVPIPRPATATNAPLPTTTRSLDAANAGEHVGGGASTKRTRHENGTSSPQQPDAKKLKQEEFSDAACEKLCREYRIDLNNTSLEDAIINSDYVNIPIPLVKWLVGKKAFKIDEDSGAFALYNFALDFSDQLDIIKHLQEAHGYILEPDQDGQDEGDTLLHDAVLERDRERRENQEDYIIYVDQVPPSLPFIRYLIGKGSDVNALNKRNESVLHLAASQTENLDIVKFLVEECNANYNIKTFNGETILYAAALSADYKIVEYLVEKFHLNVNARTKHKRTPLLAAMEDDKSAKHSVTAEYFISLIQYLLKKGADINAADDYGMTALHSASSKYALSSEMVFTYLLENCNTRIDIKDQSGKKAFNIAEEKHGMGNTPWDSRLQNNLCPYIKAINLADKILDGEEIMEEDRLKAEDWGLEFAHNAAIFEIYDLQTSFFNRFKCNVEHNGYRDELMLRAPKKWYADKLPPTLPETLRGKVLAYLEENLDSFQIAAGTFISVVEDLDPTPINLMWYNAFLEYTGDETPSPLTKKTHIFYKNRYFHFKAHIDLDREQLMPNRSSSLSLDSPNEQEELKLKRLHGLQYILISYIISLNNNCEFLFKARKNKQLMEGSLSNLLATCIFPKAYKDRLEHVLNNIVKKPIGSAHTGYIWPLVRKTEVLERANIVAHERIDLLEKEAATQKQHNTEQNARIDKLEALVTSLLPTVPTQLGGGRDMQ